MTRSLILQDFTVATPDTNLAIEPPTLETSLFAEESVDALESYDSGYKSGWADCAKAELEERSAVGVALAKNLGEAKLTHEAARRDLLTALGPFFEDIVSTLLPSMAAEAIAPTVLAELGALAEGQTLSKIEIHAAPSACAALERLGETEDLLGLTVRPEPAFADGQVSIRAGSEQRDLDMAGAVARIAEAIAGFSAQNTTSVDLNASEGAA